MSSSAGYTLAEALAAVLILGLATAGMTAGVQSFSRHQVRATKSTAAARGEIVTQTAVDALLTGAGPFSSDGHGGLNGDQQGFAFPCVSGTCEARVGRTQTGQPLMVQRTTSSVSVSPAAGGSLRFAYVTAGERVERWPPARLDTGGPAEPLQQIVLIGEPGERVIGAWRIWREQASDCAFDSIARSCRTSPTAAGTP